MSGITTPWDGVFEFEPSEGIQLEQISRLNFRLGSTVRYLKETGLEDYEHITPADIETLREVKPADLRVTDLASVPRLFLWWVNTYGTHTPAALVHDRFIGPEDVRPGQVTEQDVDRYFRYMLKALGVGWAARWLMWSAVALRTRLAGHRKWTAIAWIFLAVAGIALFLFSLVVLIEYGRAAALPYFATSVLLPLPASLLWGKQRAAGLVASYLAVPWLIIPTLATLPFFVVIRAIDGFLSWIFDRERSVRM